MGSPWERKQIKEGREPRTEPQDTPICGGQVSSMDTGLSAAVCTHMHTREWNKLYYKWILAWRWICMPMSTSVCIHEYVCICTAIHRHNTYVHLLHTPFVYIGKTHIEMNWEGWCGTMKVKLLWAALTIIIKGHDATLCRREFAYSAFRTIVGFFF